MISLFSSIIVTKKYIDEVIKEVRHFWPQTRMVNGSPGRSTTQGGVERFNLTMETKLGNWMKDNNSTRWSIGCRIACWRANTQVHTALGGKTPYQMLFGQIPTCGLADGIIDSALLDTLHTEAQLNEVLRIPEGSTIEDATIPLLPPMTTETIEPNPIEPNPIANVGDGTADNLRVTNESDTIEPVLLQAPARDADGACVAEIGTTETSLLNSDERTKELEMDNDAVGAAVQTMEGSHWQMICQPVRDETIPPTNKMNQPSLRNVVFTTTATATLLEDGGGKMTMEELRASQQLEKGVIDSYTRLQRNEEGDTGTRNWPRWNHLSSDHRSLLLDAVDHACKTQSNDLSGGLLVRARSTSGFDKIEEAMILLMTAKINASNEIVTYSTAAPNVAPNEYSNFLGIPPKWIELMENTTRPTTKEDLMTCGLNEEFACMFYLTNDAVRDDGYV